MEYYNQQEVAKRIKQARKSVGMTQCELADALNVTENNIYKLENGKTSLVIDKLVEIAQILNVSTDYLLFGRNDKVDEFQNSCKEMDMKIRKLFSEKSEKEIAYAFEVMNSILSHTKMLTN